MAALHKFFVEHKRAVAELTGFGYDTQTLFLLLSIKFGYPCALRWWKESNHFVDGGPGFAGYHCMLRNEDVPEGFTSESWKTVDLNKPKSWPWPSVGGAPFPEERV